MAEKEGFLDRTARAANKAAEEVVKATKAAAARTREVAEQVAEKARLAEEIRPKLGLNPSQMAEFMAMADAARSGQKIPELYKKNPSGYDGLLRALGDAYKKNNNILSSIDAEMAGTNGLEERFYKAIQREPNAFADRLRNYQPGALKNFVEETEQSSLPSSSLVAGAAAEMTAPSKQKAAPSVAQPAAVKPKAKKAAVAGAAVAGVAGATDEGDAEVRGLAMGIEAYVSREFPELATRAAGFQGAITGSPRLQRAIAGRLAADPAFKEQLLGGMSSRTPMDERTKNQMRPFLARVLDNPQDLGTESGFAVIKQQYGQTKDAVANAQVGGVKSWLKQNLGFLGIDFDGIFAWFGTIFSKIGHFFDGFSNGTFKSMRNSGHGLMDAFNGVWQQARKAADLEAANLAYVRALPLTKGGSFYRTEVAKGEDGQEVSRRIINTVDVRDVEGKTHKVPLSYGLHSVLRKDGNYELTLAGSVDESGTPKSIKQIVVSGEEGARYYKTLGARLREEGIQFVDQNFAEGRAPVGGRTPVVPPARPDTSPSVTRYDSDNGRVMEQIPAGSARPLPPQGPQSPASNDPEIHLRRGG